MLSPHWPRTPVEVGGRRFYLCFNLGALAAAQVIFDDRGIDVNLLEAMPELTLTNLRILFASGLQKWHPELDSGAAQRLVTFHAAFAIAPALREAWRAAAPVPMNDEKVKSRSECATVKALSRDQQWGQLWSLAVYDLKLSTETFYSLTLGQLDALIRRHERAIRDREFLFAQLGSLTVNFSMARPKQPVEPRDLMPSEWHKSSQIEQRPRRRRSRQLIAAEIRGVMEEFLKTGKSG